MIPLNPSNNRDYASIRRFAELNPSFVCTYFRTRLTRRAWRAAAVLGGRILLFRRVVRNVVQAEAFQLAVERRSPDFEAARDLRHLLVVMRYGEADRFPFDFFERPNLALRV